MSYSFDTKPAWGLLYGGWSEGAFVTSKNCLTNRFTGDLGDALNGIFTTRQDIVQDFIDNDPTFASYPGEETPGQAFPILSNEHFAPFGCLYDDDTGALKNEYQSGVDCGFPQCDAQGVPSVWTPV